MSQAYELLPILGASLILIVGGALHRRRILKKEKAQLLSDLREWKAAQQGIALLPVNSKFKKVEKPVRKWVSLLNGRIKS